jgi:hydroxymethylglutaryl-CoA lyase
LDLPALMRMSSRLPALLGHEVAGLVAKAGRPLDLHPVPEALLAS